MWNWVKGEGESWVISRVPFLNCSACVLVFESAGATVVWLAFEVGNGGVIGGVCFVGLGWTCISIYSVVAGGGPS